MRYVSALVCAVAITFAGCGGQQPAAPETPAAAAGDSKVTTVELEAKPRIGQPVESPAAPAPAPGAPAAPAPAPADGPKIESPAPVYNFGEVDNTQDVKHDFVVRNAGSGTLEIKDVKTSCGCTVAQPAKKQLAPGEETTIGATLKLSNKSGAMKKEITVTSNDPTTPTFRLALEGTAVAAIDIEPRVFAFGLIDNDEAKSMTATIKATKADLTFNIEKIVSSSPEFELTHEAVEAGKSYKVTATLKGGLKPGNYSSRILVDTDHPMHKNVALSAFAQVVGAVRVSPETLQVRASDKPGETINMQMQVSPGRVKTFQVKAVVTPVPSMKAEIEPRGETYLIKLTDIPLSADLDGKELLIKTDLADAPEIKVPIRVIKPLSGANRLVSPQGIGVGAPGGTPAVTLTPPAAPAPAPAPAPAEPPTAPAAPK